ncbi:hypothetical protein ACLBOM_29570 [Escherichia coli]
MILNSRLQSWKRKSIFSLAVSRQDEKLDINIDEEVHRLREA